MKPSPAQIHVALVEDDSSFRENLRSLLNATEGFACSESFGTAEAALPALSDNPPDLVVVDLDLPGMSGEKLLKELRRRKVPTRAVILTVYDDPRRIGDSLEAGAFGYLLKSMPLNEILDRLRDAHAGGAPMSPAVSLIVVQIFHRRGEIEAQLGAHLYRILRMLANGQLIDDIAEDMGQAPGTIRASLSKVYDALHVKNATQAVALYHGAPPRKG